MKRRILGFHRRVWWPKCTPASSSSLMPTTATVGTPLCFVSAACRSLRDPGCLGAGQGLEEGSPTGSISSLSQCTQVFLSPGVWSIASRPSLPLPPVDRFAHTGPSSLPLRPVGWARESGEAALDGPPSLLLRTRRRLFSGPPPGLAAAGRRRRPARPPGDGRR